MTEEPARLTRAALEHYTSLHEDDFDRGDVQDVAFEALRLMDERDAAIALLRRDHHATPPLSKHECRHCGALLTPRRNFDVETPRPHHVGCWWVAVDHFLGRIDGLPESVEGEEGVVYG